MADPVPGSVMGSVPGLVPGSVPGSVPVQVEAVLRELALFELKCDGEEVTEKLLDLCLSHSLDPITLANELLAFVTSKALDPQLSTDTLSAFEHEVLSRRDRRPPPPRRTDSRCLHDVHTLHQLLDQEEEEEEEQLLDSYCTPGKAPHKRAGSTPETPRPKRGSSTPSPYELLAPTCLSPSISPSPQYSSRSNVGSVVASFGPISDIDWVGGRGGVDWTPKPFGPPELNLSRSYSFMFQRAADVREVLFWRMEELGDALKAQHNIEEFGSLLIPAQDPMAVLGLIGCDSNGRLNALSVVLEGDRDRSAGAQIPLDLSGLSDFSLFPGQVVVVEGNNSTGKRMVVTRVYEGVPLPFYTPKTPPPEGGSCLVLAACGPFTPSDGVAFEPLKDLIGVIERQRPDVCLMFGPFLDTKHEQVESCRLLLPFAEVFRLCVRTLVEGTRSAGSHLVFIPSHRDAHHHFVYPQPPFVCPELPKEDKARVHFMPDPCTLEINGVVLGLTSTDVLFHLGTEEISRSSGTSDRFSRILQHILTQRSYYPLYPPAEEMNVDYETFCSFAPLPVTPHVLVTPSELRYFVKEVMGCVCINPGRLTKGRAAGTYGMIHLRPHRYGVKENNPCMAAQVVRI